MSDSSLADAKNTTLLFFLDQLAQGPRSLHDLSCQFGSPHFTNDMKQTVGNNKLGLKRFFLQFPSLFVIDGDDVRIAGSNFIASAEKTRTSTAAVMPSIMKTPPPLCKPTASNGCSQRQGSMSSDSGSLCSPSRSEEIPRRPFAQNRSFNAEDEAVQFFRQKLETFLLTHPNDEGMSLPSLLGHRSQALPHIRDVCGRNAKELIGFIRRHREVFLVIPSNDGYGQEITLVQRPKPSAAASMISAQNGDSSAVSRQRSQTPLTEVMLIEFLVTVLRDKGAYFIEQLYGHMNAKFSRDERNEFARNPRELKALIVKYCNVFVINENLVQLESTALQSISTNGLTKFFASLPRQPVKEITSNGQNGLDNSQRVDDRDDAESISSKSSGKTRPQITVQKTALEKAIRAAIESNEAHGYSSPPHPSMVRVVSVTNGNNAVSQSSPPSNVPWTEVTKVRHMKQIVREIFDVCDKIALHVVLSASPAENDGSSNKLDHAEHSINAVYVFLVSSHDTAVYGFDLSSAAARSVSCLRDGGLRELLSSEKVTKYLFNAAEFGLALTQIFSDDYETLKLRNLYDIPTACALSSFFSTSRSGTRQKFEESLLNSSSTSDLTIDSESDLLIENDLSRLAKIYAVEKVENSKKTSKNQTEQIAQAFQVVKAYFPALTDAIQSSFNLRYLPLLQQMGSGEQLERLRDPDLYVLLREQRDLHVQLDIIHDLMERRASNGSLTFSAAENEDENSALCLARECAIMRRLGQLSSLITHARNERAVKMNLLRDEQRRQTATDHLTEKGEIPNGHSAAVPEDVTESRNETEGHEQNEKQMSISVDVGCQTVITGDIIAKCLFIAGHAKIVEF